MKIFVISLFTVLPFCTCPLSPVRTARPGWLWRGLPDWSFSRGPGVRCKIANYNVSSLAVFCKIFKVKVSGHLKWPDTYGSMHFPLSCHPEPIEG